MTIKEKLKSNLTAILIAALSAGIIGDIVGIWELSFNRDDSYVELYVEQVKENARLKAEIVMKEKELFSHATLIEESNNQLPFPYWIKTVDGTIIFLNSAYENIVLKPMGATNKDIIGSNGVSVLGEEVVDVFLKNDMEVIRKGRLIKVREQVQEGVWGVSYKFPVYSNGVIILTSGLWIPE